MTSKHHEMAEWYRRAQEEILDSMDEELEMELDDDRLSQDGDSDSSVPRNVYFKELFRLQEQWFVWLMNLLWLARFQDMPLLLGLPELCSSGKLLPLKSKLFRLIPLCFR